MSETTPETTEPSEASLVKRLEFVADADDWKNRRRGITLTFISTAAKDAIAEIERLKATIAARDNRIDELEAGITRWHENTQPTIDFDQPEPGTVAAEDLHLWKLVSDA